MKILYAAALSPNDTSLYRLWALERLGHRVFPLNAYEYRSKNALVRKIEMRLSAGPSVDKINRDLLRLAETERPDVLWADKLLFMRPETLDRVRAMGLRL
jgi:spore maturation protein CgeB